MRGSLARPGTKSAPSRRRLRPAIRPTSAEASATRRAINLGRSVLGAATTLGDTQGSVKHPCGRISRNFRVLPQRANSGRTVPFRQRSLPRRHDRGQTLDTAEQTSGAVTKACRPIHGSAGDQPRTTKKCTEPVTPSSSFPTDRRRSDCHSENLQPRALRTRCMRDSRAAYEPRQDHVENDLAQIATFSFHTGHAAPRRACSSDLEREKAAGPEDPAADSPSRERFRPPSRRTFRFRVVLLGGLRPTGAPCSAQA
jgi:hypothetical protein